MAAALLAAFAVSCSTVGSARVQIDDPVTPDVDYRTAEFAIFRTLCPRARIELSPSIDPSSVRVLIDRGDAEPADGWLDVTRLFNFRSGAAEARIPHTALFGALPGPHEHDREHPEHPGQTIIVFPGANRLRILVGQNLVRSAHFLCYNDRFDLIAPAQHGVDTLPGTDVRVSSNELSVFFPPEFETDAAISEFLRTERLRPIGIMSRDRCLIVRDVCDLDIQALLLRAAELRGRIGDPEAVGVNPLPSPGHSRP